MAMAAKLRTGAKSAINNCRVRTELGMVSLFIHQSFLSLALLPFLSDVAAAFCQLLRWPGLGYSVM